LQGQSELHFLLMPLEGAFGHINYDYWQQGAPGARLP